MKKFFKTVRYADAAARREAERMTCDEFCSPARLAAAGARPTAQFHIRAFIENQARIYLHKGANEVAMAALLPSIGDVRYIAEAPHMGKATIRYFCVLLIRSGICINGMKT
jgi:hypothetical protein